MPGGLPGQPSEDPMDGSGLAALERAELAARERRLAAMAEAERIVAVATERARAIEAELPERVAAAVAARRREHRERTAAAIAAVDGELATFERRAIQPGPSDPAFERAVELVVVAVLGEDRQER
jgi:hypothetical protein